jgi:hypothetical protein
MCALPLHVWTMILAFRDLSWVADRTNAWDAVGVLSYGLVFAFVESLVVFAVAALLGFLVSVHWGPRWRISLLTVLVLVLSLWAIAEQLYFLLNLRLPTAMIDTLLHTDHPFRVLNAGVVGLVSATFLVPTVLMLRSGKAVRFVEGLIERLSLLTMFYLVFDVAGLVIVLIRNL